MIGSFYAKYTIFDLKSRDELPFVIMKRDAKFEEKLTSGLENDMRNMHIFTRALEGPKIETLVGSFTQNRICIGLNVLKSCVP